MRHITALSRAHTSRVHIIHVAHTKHTAMFFAPHTHGATKREHFGSAYKMYGSDFQTPRSRRADVAAPNGFL